MRKSETRYYLSLNGNRCDLLKALEEKRGEINCIVKYCINEPKNRMEISIIGDKGDLARDLGISRDDIEIY